jgi:hypothetical protein
MNFANIYKNQKRIANFIYNSAREYEAIALSIVLREVEKTNRRA